MSGLPDRGDTSQTTLPKLLVRLHRARATGTLSVSSGALLKKIFFKKGSAIFASSNFEDDRLGEMLVKSGKITVEQYDRSVGLLKTGKRLGAILVELGYITPKELFWGVKYQVKEIIYSAFQFDRAEYEFSEDEHGQDEVITLKMSMGNLIYEGVKRIENWTRIRKELPATESVLKLTDDPLSLFQEVELSHTDKKILSLVDGKRNIKHVIEDSWLNGFEAMKILYVLWSIGILTEKKVEGAAISVDELFRPVSEGEETLRRRVEEMEKRVASGSSYGLLGVEPEAGLDQIKKNYYRLAKEFHPDRLFDSDDSVLKDRLSAIFDSITDAYNSLKEAAYLSEEAFIGEGAGASRQAESFAGDPFGGQDAFRLDDLDETPAKNTDSKKDEEKAAQEHKHGLETLKSGNVKKALGYLKLATELNPRKAEYWSVLALAWIRSGGSVREAEHALREAIKLDPGKGDYYANLGLLFMKAGSTQDAKKQFEMALALEPGNQKARQGLKQIR